MAFRRSDLQEAFFVPGTHAFRVWGYGTCDALEEVLRPGYFAAAGTLLRPGEVIYVSARQRIAAPGMARGADPRDVHMALVMVVRGAERGSGRNGFEVRLVQDFGSPGAPAATRDPALAPSHLTEAAAPAAAPKRGRGRPPGSRTRKNGAMPTTSIN